MNDKRTGVDELEILLRVFLPGKARKGAGQQLLDGAAVICVVFDCISSDTDGKKEERDIL